ncbi:3114_t:CDS:1 [Ambispora gerdemannii]|uniref:3114_t:CDS:1 n=1 Tax=Ambispora gerdemannii TaxID=144530 RepID=A0A9N9DV61_9GLOM|nr:3114_t:CDS:1 [Ambispora gerdemannii]
MLQRVAPHKGIKKTNICCAITEWLIVDNHPLDIINGEGFRWYMLQIDPAFRRPSYKALKKEISFGNTNARNQIHELLEKNSEIVSLTTDLWTARNGTGYIVITAHWLSKQFELNEILLCLESMPYPHTSQIIREFLIRKVQDFNLQNKILCVITDNGSNMITAIRNWNGVERLPCTAHTLQLSVNRALKKNHQQIHRIRELVKFFNSPKQSQRLDAAQIEVYKQKRRNNISLHDLILLENSDYDDDSENEMTTNYPIDKFILILKNVKDIPTRWNSKYQS